MLSREIAERCAEHAIHAATSQRYLIEGGEVDAEPHKIDRVDDLMDATEIARKFFADDTLRLTARVVDTIDKRVVCTFP